VYAERIVGSQQVAANDLGALHQETGYCGRPYCVEVLTCRGVVSTCSSFGSSAPTGTAPSLPSSQPAKHGFGKLRPASSTRPGFYALSRVERVAITGLIALRWAALVWMGIVLVVDYDDLVRPWVAFGLIGAALLFTALATRWLQAAPELLLRPRVLCLEFTIAFALVVCDGWAYAPGHVFSNSLSLGSLWPLAAVLSIGLGLGVAWGIAAGVARWSSTTTALTIIAAAAVVIGQASLMAHDGPYRSRRSGVRCVGICRTLGILPVAASRTVTHDRASGIGGRAARVVADRGSHAGKTGNKSIGGGVGCRSRDTRACRVRGYACVRGRAGK